MLLLRKLLLLLAVAGVACCHLSCGNVTSAFEPAAIELGVKDMDPPYILSTNTQYFLTVTVRNNLGSDDTDRYYNTVIWATTPTGVASVRYGSGFGWMLETGPVPTSCTVSAALNSHRDVKSSFTITVQ